MGNWSGLEYTVRHTSGHSSKQPIGNAQRFHGAGLQMDTGAGRRLNRLKRARALRKHAHNFYSDFSRQNNTFKFPVSSS